MDAFSIVTLSTLLWKMVQFIKNLTNRLWDPALTQVLAWVFGILLVALAVHASLASTIKIWGTTLDKLNWASLLLLGLSLSSFSSALVEVKKAVDRNDSAVQPSLAPANSPPRWRSTCCKSTSDTGAS